MTKSKLGGFGTWLSPITADDIVAGTVGIAEAQLRGENLYWIELRPQEKGRAVVVRRRPDGSIEDVTPPPFSARTRVHEYGGGAYAVDQDTIYFANFADQRVYRQPIGASPEPITPESDLRFADLVVAPGGRGLVAVREDHTEPDREAVNTLVWLDADRIGAGTVLVEGDDFYASPRLDTEGKKLAWLTWNHPNMPWDGTELWVADVGADGTLANHAKVAGGATESVFQPEWSPDGLLYFVSDRTGWWNLYRCRDGRSEPLSPKVAEFGLPQWVFGLSNYGFASADEIVATYREGGESHLVGLDVATWQSRSIPVPHTEAGYVAVSGGVAAFVGGSSERQGELVRVDLATGEVDIVRRSSTLEMDASYRSTPETIEFPTDNNLTAHAFFYPPHNEDYEAPEGEKPPLLVLSHGGPTSSASSVLSPKVQYWTSRGIAVVDVNYGGSTGYGRAYRERLNGRWGVVDVADCIHAAKYLIEQRRADPDRVAIRGGSAGGYTTLAALTFHDLFRAGASYYGVSDLELLVRDTHKFESRYLDSLLGPYPQERELYRERSPIHAVDRLTCPVIFFQGLKDRVVPPNQAELMFEAVRQAGFPTAYVTFEGEDHGFREAENIKRALEAELYFYGRVFGFQPADDIDPVDIQNPPT